MRATSPAESCTNGPWPMPRSRARTKRASYRSLFTHRRNDSNDCKVQTDLSGDEFDDSGPFEAAV